MEGIAERKSYGKWHTVYARMNRWNKAGVLQRLFEALQVEGVIQIKYGVGLPLQHNGQGAS